MAGALTDVQNAVQNAAETFAQETNGGVLSVAARFLPTGETLFVNAEEIFPTASVIKIAIVSELYTQAGAGKIDPQTPITVGPDDIVPGSGVLSTLTMPLPLTLRDLSLLTISVSDNTASNLCLRAVGGPGAVNARMREWGMKNTTVYRPIKFDLTSDDAPHTATGTPEDMLLLLTLLHKGLVGDRSASDAVLRLMEQCQSRDNLPRYLDVNPYSDALKNPPPPFTVQNKTGGVTGVRNDAALIARGDATLAVCAYSKNSGDNRWTSANVGCETLAQIGKTLTDHFFA